MSSLGGNPFPNKSIESQDIYISIGSFRTKKMVTLKPYVESFSMSIDKKTEQYKTNEYSPYKDVIDKETSMSVSLSLNVVASDPDEAELNLKKINELQDMINGPAGEASALIVHFANLINACKTYKTAANGYVTTKNITNFAALKKHGVACICDEVSYDPDLEKGMIRLSNGQYVAKYLKLSLNLKYVFQKLMASDNTSYGDFFFMNSYTTNGMHVPNDRPNFPLGIASKNSYEPTKDSRYIKQNDYAKNLNKDANTWIFIGNNIDTENIQEQMGEISASLDLITTEDELEFRAAENNIYYDSDIGYKLKRFVFFDPYIESFKKLVKVENKSGDQTSLEPFKTTYQSTVFQDIVYELVFNCPSEDYRHGILNLSKIQTLVRLFATRSELKNPGFIANGNNLAYTFKQGQASESFSNVCIPSFIQKIGTNPSTPAKSYQSSLRVNIVELKIDIDVNDGLINNSGFLVPKNYKITLKMIPFKGEQNAHLPSATVNTNTGTSETTEAPETSANEDTTTRDYPTSEREEGEPQTKAIDGEPDETATPSDTWALVPDEDPL